jgi:hypothetical protein
MGMGSSVQCCPGRIGVAVLMVAGTALAGCSGSLTGGSDWFPSMPGFSTVVTSSAEDTKALAAAAGAGAGLEINDNCPTLDIRTGAGTLAVAARTATAPTANDLRYQVTIAQLARQCALADGNVRMRIGVQGRVIVGPAGAPSQVDVPLRYAVVREGVEPKTITTKFKRFPVAVPPGAPNTSFTDIEEDVTFPMPPGDQILAYVVYIGFDGAGDAAVAKKGGKK